MLALHRIRIPFRVYHRTGRNPVKTLHRTRAQGERESTVGNSVGTLHGRIRDARASKSGPGFDPLPKVAAQKIRQHGSETEAKLEHPHNPGWESEFSSAVTFNRCTEFDYGDTVIAVCFVVREWMRVGNGRNRFRD